MAGAHDQNGRTKEERGDVQRIFQGAGHGAVVFGGDEKNRIGALDFLAKGDPRRGSVFSFEILVVEGRFPISAISNFSGAAFSSIMAFASLRFSESLRRLPISTTRLGTGFTA